MAARQIMEFQPELVISTNTPLEAQYFIMQACTARRVAFVNWIQDLYGTGVSTILARMWPALRPIGNLYRREEARQAAASDHVILIDPQFKAAFPGLGGADRLSFISNWGSLGEIRAASKINSLSVRLGVSHTRNVLYSGTLGMKHSTAPLAALGEVLGEQPDARLVVAANGAGVPAFREEIARRAFHNVILRDLLPIGDFPDLLGSADVGIALLDASAGRFSVPSKILSYMCAGLPIVLSAPLDNMAAAVVREASAGICVEPTNIEGFTNSIVNLLNDAPARARFGKSGRAYAKSKFDMKVIGPAFEAVFVKALRSNHNNYSRET
jgi:colanic acid biosynthesis glycosyl transferase WcaI